jgi:hypothetical protein
MNDGSVHITCLPAHGEPWPYLTNHHSAEFRLHTSIQHLLLLLIFSPTPASRTPYRTILTSIPLPKYLPADDEWRGLAQDVWEHAGYSANAVRRTWLCIP